MENRVSNTVLENTSGKQGWLTKVGSFLSKHMTEIACVFFMCLMVSGVVSADEAGVTADSLWITVIGLVKTWVTRLGAVVMIIGGVMFGLGWQHNDAPQKSSGVYTMIAGAIVIAVVQLIGQFAV